MSLRPSWQLTSLALEAGVGNIDKAIDESKENILLGKTSMEADLQAGACEKWLTTIDVLQIYTLSVKVSIYRDTHGCGRF